MKRWCVLALVCCILCAGLAGMPTAFALGEQQTAQAPTSKCNSYLLADFDTGEILLANKPDERIYPASTTKILTALILIEQRPDLSEKIQVGAEVNRFGPDASLMHLAQYEEISYKDLLYGMMLVSGNDAAAAVAVSLGGSIEGFADMMNQKAQELGMTGSHFTNPHGLHDEDHYTTTADLSKLAIAAMQNPVFAECVATKEYTTSPTNKAPQGHALVTTNRLISPKEQYAEFNYAPAIGIKTGATNAAQGCLVAAARKDGRTLIAVLMGDSTWGSNGDKYVSRWTDAVKLFEYGFGLTRVDIAPILSPISLSATLPGGSAPVSLRADVPESLGFWTDAQTAASITAGSVPVTAEVALSSQANVPLPDASIGTVTYKMGDLTLSTQNVYTNITTPTQVVEEVSAFLGITDPRMQKIVIWGGGLVICLILLILAIKLPARKRKKRKAKRRARNDQWEDYAVGRAAQRSGRAVRVRDAQEDWDAPGRQPARQARRTSPPQQPERQARARAREEEDWRNVPRQRVRQQSQATQRSARAAQSAKRLDDRSWQRTSRHAAQEDWEQAPRRRVRWEDFELEYGDERSRKAALQRAKSRRNMEDWN